MTTFAILGEDESDTATVASIVRKLRGESKTKVLKKGYGGAGQLLKMGARQIRAFHTATQCNRFIICFDSDGGDANDKRQKILDEVVLPSKIDAKFCALVPIQEIEAWIIADLAAVRNVVSGFRVPDPLPGCCIRPEDINNPKEFLVRITRDERRRDRYSNKLHNEKVASYLDLEVVQERCPSFHPLVDIVVHDRPNIELH